MVQRQGLIKGAATGLQLWLIFLLSLFWLGYSAPFSIGLGALAGLCGGIISNWLQSEPIDAKAAAAKQAEAIDPDIQVEDGATYHTSALKQYALRRQRQKEWHKRKWNHWKTWQIWKKSS
jgi:hypothetical protein